MRHQNHKAADGEHQETECDNQMRAFYPALMPGLFHFRIDDSSLPVNYGVHFDMQDKDIIFYVMNTRPCAHGAKQMVAQHETFLWNVKMTFFNFYLPDVPSERFVGRIN
jgi:hypothetical protein